MQTPQPSAPRSQTSTLLLLLLLLLVGLLLSPVLGYGFVWDDAFLLRDNPWMHTWRNLPPALLADFFRFTRKGADSGFYRPLVTFTYFAQQLLGGGGPRLGHLINLALHLLNGALVFYLARGLQQDTVRPFPSEVPASSPQTPSPEPAPPVLFPLLAAAFFLVLPVNLEPMAWISGRPELLAATFSLAALNVTPGALLRPQSRRLMALFLLLALLSKEVALVLPLLIWARARAAVVLLPFRPALGRTLLPSMAGALCAYFTLRYVALGHFGLGSSSPLPATALAWLAASREQLGAAGHYVARLVWPLHLGASPLQPQHGFASSTVILGLSWALLLGVGWLVTLRKGPHTSPEASALHHHLACWGLPLLPSVLALPGGPDLPDRFLYLPSVGVSLLLAQVLTRSRFWKPLTLLGFLLLAAWAGMLSRGLHHWESDLSLWGGAVQRQPDSALAQLNYGVALGKAGQAPRAVEHYRKALALEKASPRFDYVRRLALFNLGNQARAAGRAEEALTWYQQVLAENPGDVPAWTNMGVTLLSLERHAQAEAAFRRTLALSPDWPAGWKGLGATLASAKRYAEAKEAYTRYLSLKPTDEGARADLAQVTALAGSTP